MSGWENTLCEEREHYRISAVRAERDRALMHDTLTHCQARCTELLEENRALKAGRDEANARAAAAVEATIQSMAAASRESIRNASVTTHAACCECGRTDMRLETRCISCDGKRFEPIRAERDAAKDEAMRLDHALDMAEMDRDQAREERDALKSETERLTEERDEARAAVRQRLDYQLVRDTVEAMLECECDRAIAGERHVSVGLRALVSDAHAMAVEKGWYEDGPRPVAELIALMHSELSEALEELRNGHAPTEVYVVDGKVEGFPIELADCVIRIADACGALGIDLADAVERKLAYNATRPKRHGGKTL